MDARPESQTGNASFPGHHFLKRFYDLERKLIKYSQLYTTYCKFMTIFMIMKHSDTMKSQNIQVYISYLTTVS